MSEPKSEPEYAVGRFALRACGGVLIAILVQASVVGAPSAPAALALLVTILLVAMTAGRQASVPAALVACYVYGDHHLADRHGVLGTPSVAKTFLLVQALAIVVAMVGDHWWTRAGVREAVVDTRTVDRRAPRG